MRKLFKGLWIYDKLTRENHPVIHLDFLGLENGSREELIESLAYLVNRNAAEYGIELKETVYNKRFKELVAQLSTINRVVILVDEYDKPIIDNLDNPDVAIANRKILKTFCETIKESDRSCA